jgi:peptidyl-prolyl cis-trans isomerase C
MKKPYILLALLVVIAALLAGCSEKSPPKQTALVQTPEETPTSLYTPTPVPPTLTPVPLAASVNGEGIPLEEFQAELGRYAKAQQDAGSALPNESEQHQIVLDEMIGEMLLAQAAYAEGFVLSDADLKARLAALEGQVGAEVALAEWQQKNGYTALSFEAALKRSVAAAWKRDQLAAGVPATTEQVHAQQILVYDKATADALLSDIRAGVEFATYAVQYDPLTGGELGWFPRGFLSVFEVEEAAFSLQPGEVSQVIQSKVGYHIIFIEERDSQHLLSPDARQVLQRLGVQQWVTNRRKTATIQILVP